MAIDKWGEAKELYLLTHQHGDHLRKAKALPKEVTVIVSKARDEYYGMLRDKSLSKYYEYLKMSLKNFKKVVLEKGRITEISRHVGIQLVNADLHSDIYFVRYSHAGEVRTALIIADIDSHQEDAVLREVANRVVDEVYLVCYSRIASHKEEPYRDEALHRVVNRLGRKLKSPRHVLKVPKIIALGHSEGAKKPPWADKFIPPIKAKYTFASPR